VGSIHAHYSFLRHRPANASRHIYFGARANSPTPDLLTHHRITVLGRSHMHEKLIHESREISQTLCSVGTLPAFCSRGFLPPFKPSITGTRVSSPKGMGVYPPSLCSIAYTYPGRNLDHVSVVYQGGRATRHLLTGFPMWVKAHMCDAVRWHVRGWLAHGLSPLNIQPLLVLGSAP